MKAGSIAAAAAAATLLLWGWAGHADESDPQDNQRAPNAAPPRLELALVPLFGGDTDIGLGAGVIASVARPAPEPIVFRWKLEGAVFASAKHLDGVITSPYRDIYVKLTRKDLWRGRMRLELRAAYTRETNLRYYGLGNAAPAPPGDDVAARDFFTRRHPTVSAMAQVRMFGHVNVFFGTMYMQNRVDIPTDSTLARDAAMGSDRVRRLLTIDDNHGLHLLEAGLVFDSRDDEVAPARGQHHIVQMRASPWRTAGMPYRYAGFSGSFSGFVPLWPGTDRLVLAARIVGDLQIGDVPFYELSRFDETSAIGGPKYVRGVPSNRYWGKRKALGNLELRTLLFAFHALKTEYRLGATAFFDAGRVWADVGAAPELDGTGLGIKYGTGGGLRLQKGKTFVLRADLAWSPDAHPVSAYFLAEHIF